MVRTRVWDRWHDDASCPGQGSNHGAALISFLFLTLISFLFLTKVVLFFFTLYYGKGYTTAKRLRQKGYGKGYTTAKAIQSKPSMCSYMGLHIYNYVCSHNIIRPPFSALLFSQFLRPQRKFHLVVGIFVQCQTFWLDF